jgi:hypothetical protein
MTTWTWTQRPPPQRYAHDCAHCVYRGTVVSDWPQAKTVDWYTHQSPHRGWDVTLLGRHGGEGSAYFSMSNAARELETRWPPHRMAREVLRRARIPMYVWAEEE